jgi:hypothetical protein
VNVRVRKSLAAKGTAEVMTHRHLLTNFTKYNDIAV